MKCTDESNNVVVFHDEGKGTHITVFTKIMSGDFDYQLKWPFQGSLNITLLDQEGEEHWMMCLAMMKTHQRNVCVELLGHCNFIHCFLSPARMLFLGPPIS